MKTNQLRITATLCHASACVTALLAVVTLLSSRFIAGGAAAFVPVLQNTFINPAPADSDAFGAAFTFVRSDRVVIGAPGVSANSGRGAAYLFNLDDTFLTNVAPYGAFHFGWSLASLPLATLPGYDAVYIGAEYGYDLNYGVVYSFDVSTNGESSVPQFWSPEFRNPDYSFDPGDKFSASVATLGSERLIVGAPESGQWKTPPEGGAVFLYDIYHAYAGPLTIITNPFPNPSAIGFPSISVLFGWSVAAIGNEGILIGAPGSASGSGSAYIYSTNGSLLTVFTNRSAAVSFGYSLAALGPDRIIVGAPSLGLSGVAGRQGLTFLFSTNGMLLTTFSNPVPTNSSARLFGGSVAAVGSDRVLIGASRGRTNTGAAFLFSTNGALLATFINPTGAANDSFGTTVASLGSDRILIGDTTSPYGGAAYLFNLVPAVEMERTSTNTLAISWSALAADFTLQENTNSIASVNWSNVMDTVQNDGTNNYIILDSPVGNRFYRLHKP